MNKKFQINKIREQIESLNKLHGVIDASVIKEKLDSLNANLRDALGDEHSSSKNDNSDSIDSFNTNENILAALGDRSVVVGGDAKNLNIVTGNGNSFQVHPEDISLEILFKAYFCSVASECNNLPLGIVDPRFDKPTSEENIKLFDLYTELSVTLPPSTKNMSRREWSTRLLRRDIEEKTPVLDVIQVPEAARIVLLGDPGSGKSTFINHFTCMHIHNLLGHKNDSIYSKWTDKFLIRLVLRNSATHIPLDSPKGSAHILWDIIKADLINRLGEAAGEKLFPHVQSRIWGEGAVILLDGLDEVPEAGRRRKCLIEAIQDFTKSLYKESLIILTARPYAYSDPDWHLNNYQVLALAPFNLKQIEYYVRHWYKAIRPIRGWSTIDIERRSNRLIKTLKTRPYLLDLASRPLLLTLIASLHSSWGQLPEDRADLYEESIKLLLSRWEKGRGHGQTHADKSSTDQEVLRFIDLSEDILRTILEKLAYQIHNDHGLGEERDVAPADLLFSDLLVAFTPFLPKNINPIILLEYLETRSGLLVSRQEGVFAFPHRSFQEYLAACHLANDQEFGFKLKDIFCKDPQWWREVVLLAIGKARQGGMANAITILNILLPENLHDVKDIQDTHWQLSVLVAQSLVELRLNERNLEQPFYSAIQRRSIEWIKTLMEGDYLTPLERLQAGEALGSLGDPRKGVGIVSHEKANILIPDITWQEIPKGKFRMGISKGDPFSDGDEFPSHSVDLLGFQISRYPITNLQYHLFWANNGYDTPKYWTTEGWNWRQGIDPEFISDEVTYSDNERKEQYIKWNQRRTGEKRETPFWYNDIQWNISNFPVVGINWYEATAYCCWLDELLRAINHPLMRPNYVVRLPCEAEWEKAASGPKGFRWPWGNQWSDNFANTSELGLKRTSPVGMFTRNSSIYDVMDMSGNVYEWVLTGLGRKVKYGAPYDGRDGRNNLESTEIRIVKGGAWCFDRISARCSMREWDFPTIFDQNTGFRVVIGLPFNH